MQDNITISGKVFSVMDTIDNITVADSFVKNNKLRTTRGNGEARLYIGPQNESGRFYEFFDHFRAKCFVTKEDLYKYLVDAEIEYKLQEQQYRRNISSDLNNYNSEVVQLDSNEVYFDVKPALGSDTARFYVRSDASIWTLLREIALPKISYISLLRLKDTLGGSYVYFRLFVDYNYSKANHPKIIQRESRRIESSKIDEETKSEIKYSRDGQGKYREKLLAEMPACPFTGVTEERLLIASHIKPWVVADDREKIDPYNGFIFTPTYDRLFDQGFITFKNDKMLMVSPYLSPMNKKRLSLIESKIITSLPISGREGYLAYHRENIFKH